MASYGLLVEYYNRQIRNCTGYTEQCRLRAEPEIVHQLRLSIKKLRAFHTLAQKLGLPESDSYRQVIINVKKMFRLAGQIRDTQVQIFMLASCREETGKVYNLFQKWLEKLEKKKISQLCRISAKAIENHIPGDSTENNNSLKNTLTDADIINGTHKLLDEMYFDIQKLSTGSISVENLHEIRKATKQIRYILTLLNGIYADFRYNRITAEELKEIENTIGQWHDNLVRINYLDQFTSRIQKLDEAVRMKYKDLYACCCSSLNEAYQEACQEVKMKFLS